MPLELKDLHPDILKIEFRQRLTTADIWRLSRTSRFFRDYYRETLRIERLAHYIIAEPNVYEVRMMVRDKPALLKADIPKVVNHLGQSIINNKPFSLAYGAGNEEMCLMLEKK